MRVIASRIPGLWNGSFVQRAAKADPNAKTVLPMGGSQIEPSEGSRVTEAAVRGFWKGWREFMEL